LGCKNVARLWLHKHCGRYGSFQRPQVDRHASLLATKMLLTMAERGNVDVLKGLGCIPGNGGLNRIERFQSFCDTN
jgi:hypothetical protein